jgi:hypothetical protein
VRSVTGLGATLGGLIGGYIPVLWGASSFSLASIAFGFAGAIAGLIVGARLAAG